MVTEFKDQYSAWDKAEAWAGAANAVQDTHQERIKRWNDELEYFLVYVSYYPPRQLLQLRVSLLIH